MIKKTLKINKKDNCIVLLEDVNKGDFIEINGKKIQIKTSLILGHKLASENIPKGSKVIKFGASLGTAIQDISLGEHIHTHNLMSDFIDVYSGHSNSNLRGDK